MKKSIEIAGSVLAVTAAIGIGKSAVANTINNSPLGALTNTITNLYRGKSAEVTSRPINVPRVLVVLDL
jgi:ribosomal protein S8E